MARKGRSLKGGRHHQAKLSEAQVIEIRSRYASGERQVALAEEFGVGQTQISHIVTRKQWGHL
jgi:hypothetical protein